MGIEINVPIEKLRARKLFVAAPMYGGQCAGMFARSIADLSALCTHYGIQVRFYFLFNESLITRARNYCADEFMRSGDTHMMFIDSDIGFNFSRRIRKTTTTTLSLALIPRSALAGKRSSLPLTRVLLTKILIVLKSMLATTSSILLAIVVRFLLVNRLKFSRLALDS